MARRPVELEYKDINGVLEAGKTCSKCSTWKPLNEFNKQSGRTSGTRPSCKECQSNDYKKYRVENKAAIITRHRVYYKSNKEKVMKYRAENKAKLDAYFKRYRVENKDILKERGRKYREKNRQIVLEKSRLYYRENKERLSLVSKKYYKLNKDKYRLYARNREARIRGLKSDLTTDEQAHLLQHFRGCALTESSEIHWDHVIPLATGHGGTTFNNIIPLRQDLNLSKGASNIFEWFEIHKDHYALSQYKFNNLIKWLASVNKMSEEEYREYVYYCHKNPRTLDIAQTTNEGEAI